jgi:FixJ family two-component response regulator
LGRGFNADETVFIVDDDPAILRSLHRLVTVHGFACQTFNSAETFRAFANPNEGLCLVLDINLSGSSGIELSRILAASSSSLPIIFMTGNNDDHVRKEANDAGCLAFLTKPFSARSLLDAIDLAMALRKNKTAMQGRLPQDIPARPLADPDRPQNASAAFLSKNS